MQLVLINEKKQIVHVYENSCTKEQIDSLFDEYIKLIEKSKKPPMPAMPSITYTGPDLNLFMQQLVNYTLDEHRRRAELEKKVKSWMYRTGGESWLMKIKTAFMNWISKKFTKKSSPKQ